MSASATQGGHSEWEAKRRCRRTGGRGGHHRRK